MRLWVLLLAATSLPVVLLGCSSYSKFLNKKQEKFCETQARCNADIPCDLGNSLDTGYNTTDEDCDFDARAARDCLKGKWTCDDTFAGEGFSYPLSPEACSRVCASVVE